jgi:S-formylglutathione hydrolase FrmB
MFWDAFPAADIALLERGFHVAFIDAGDTYASPAALTLFDTFYDLLTTQYGLSRRPALEGLSRGGFCAYRWAYFNAEKVGCLYGDAPLCDIGLLRRRSNGEAGAAWQNVTEAYGLPADADAASIEGNPIDGLAVLAEAHIPIIHVCGDSDTAAVNRDNTDIVRERYTKLGGDFTLIMKEGCGHHPHGLQDPSSVADFIVAHAANGAAAAEASLRAPQAGEAILLPDGRW